MEVVFVEFGESCRETNRPRCSVTMKVLSVVLIALLAWTQSADGQFDGIIHNIAKSTLCENVGNGCEDSFECCVSLLNSRQRKSLINRVAKCGEASGVGPLTVLGGGPSDQQKVGTMRCMSRDQLAQRVLTCVLVQRRRC
ncbi:uncharacterized protein LOC119599075 isoform X2 [Penaeus monodon]|uniref:uncharacterized protein LOC119599075 isoform X2 n=1 Tax=Penaeus monodon TaxID=6687 RepID=UPI0018A7C9E4|nr:uncharacterized protein LOC119599075 isoform X2 [Penaeus monodon]